MGKSVSFAKAVRLKLEPRCKDWSGMAERVGAAFTSVTKMEKVSAWLRAGSPLSVTRAVTG
jgi:hypothetical protein